MKRNEKLSLGGIVVIAVAALIGTIVAGNSVLLGLDLDGGAEVVLEPVADTELSGQDLDDALDRSVQIIRNRVDGLGVAEPDITRQGDRIIVQLPGVEDQQRALEVVGQTAELRFRPVCAILLPEALSADGTGGADGEPVPAFDPNDVDGDGVRDQPFGFSPFDADTEPATGDATPGDGTGSSGETDTGGAPAGVGCENIAITPTEALSMPDTLLEDEEPDQPVVFGDSDPLAPSRYLLGRTMLTGAALQTADSGLVGVEWQVRPTFRSGPEGIDLFNDAASACFGVTTVCPSINAITGQPTGDRNGQFRGQLAIVLDGVVVSAPLVNTPVFDRDAIVISGAFTQAEAEDTALVLKFGALPLEFGDPTDPDSGSRVRLVSATLGHDSLRAGVVSGIIGLVLVATYMIAYYRLLGVAAMLSLAVSGSMLWVILAFLSETRSLALTLAGIVGLIVSIGTSLDSNVVYFEHLKEDISKGRTLRSSVDRSFPVAFKTIFYANLASLMGAVILYWLTVGSVRGFALMLGLASVLDLVATYFFLRPLVRIMARGQSTAERPGLFGLARQDAVDLGGTS